MERKRFLQTLVEAPARTDVSKPGTASKNFKSQISNSKFEIRHSRPVAPWSSFAKTGQSITANAPANSFKSLSKSRTDLRQTITRPPSLVVELILSVESEQVLLSIQNIELNAVIKLVEADWAEVKWSTVAFCEMV